MIITVDGQGGKIGKMVVEQLKQKLPSLPILAIGTNSIATATMLKAGADAGATGENPVLVNAKKADIIVGPLGIIIADALLGEITPRMAQAICQSEAQKILLPVNKCQTTIVGLKEITLSEVVALAVAEVEQTIKKS
ncbi:MAG TPA: hypothetical protein DDZ53_01525 [Firmicutes bacterium]|jgi:hypothetical protein|nr:hypothetical protein [Bacillota bacterium]